MPPGVKQIGCWCGAALLLLVCLYCVLCLLQAGSIHTGERAARNLRFWGTGALLSLGASAVSALLAFRARKAKRAGADLA
jgi:coproporphyrinogen III oxidase-like Fe-S oxidoreductase